MSSITVTESQDPTRKSEPMTMFQIAIVGLCVLINVLDGFDTMVIAFAAPAISRSLGLNPTEVGFLLSSGLAGMAIGSFFISPLGDRFGRRPTVLLCLALMTVGMLLSATSQTTTQLAITRVVSGLGLGGILSNLATVVAEYASDRRRNFAIAVMTLGSLIGGVIGGLISVPMTHAFGWQSVFALGGILSAILIPVVALTLPESVHYLSNRQPAGALEKINRVRARLNTAPLDVLPRMDRTVDASRPIIPEVFQGAMIRVTFLAILLNMFVMSGVFFATSWTPNILSGLGFSDAVGIYTGTLMYGVGFVGSLLFGILADRFGLRVVATTVISGLGLSLVLFGIVPAQAMPIIFAAALCGFFAAASMTSLYAMMPRAFPSSVRATGTGIGLGAGRIGAVIGPFVAGVLMTDGWSRFGYCTVLAIAPLLAVFVLWGLRDAVTS